MVEFSGGNGQVFISKKQKDLAVKSIPFVLKSYGKMSLLNNQYELPWLKFAMRPSNHEAFSGKNTLLASTKPPWTNTPYNFEHVAGHLTSPAMNFRPVILKKKYCYLREFTAESSLISTINPSNFTLF